MAKIIVKCSHVKNPSRSNTGKYVKYIGTRDGVEKLPYGYDDRPFTKKQQKLIASITESFPDTKSIDEYNDFYYHPSRYNASRFIDKAIELNRNQMVDMKAITKYIAERPGVEKLGAHGLFSSSDERINIDEVADRVSNHNGVVWNEIISLKREDAERLGYNNANSWKELLRRRQIDIAVAHKIKPTDLEWYAAYHDTDKHPHIHLILMSKSGEGFLTQQGIEKMKSIMVNEIFKNEQFKLFELQTQARRDIKTEIEDILKDFNDKDMFNFNTTDLICKLNRLNIDMKNLKGKKVYGYLPKELKKSVNDIVEELYKIPSVKSLYDKWIEVNNLKLSVYYDSKDNPFIKMSDNKEFNLVKNMIIKAAIELGQYSDLKHPPKLISNRIVNKMTGSILSGIADLIFDLDNRIKAKIPQIVESKQMRDIIEKKIARGLKYETVEEKEEPEEEQGFGLIM